VNSNSDPYLLGNIRTQLKPVCVTSYLLTKSLSFKCKRRNVSASVKPIAVFPAKNVLADLDALPVSFYLFYSLKKDPILSIIDLTNFISESFSPEGAFIAPITEYTLKPHGLTISGLFIFFRAKAYPNSGLSVGLRSGLSQLSDSTAICPPSP
jgi:hypothetical protein